MTCIALTSLKNGLGFNLGFFCFVLGFIFVFRVSWQVQYFVDLEMLLCGP